MRFDKLGFQLRIENYITQSGTEWKSYKQNTILNSSQVFILNEDLKQDAKYFYFKGLLSMIQGIIDVKTRLYSWATIEFYYSIFYFMRASLCIKKEGFFRHERDLFHIPVVPNAVFAKCSGSDHKATIESFQKLYGKNGIDPIQSNTINGKNSYDWFVEQREVVNYKHKNFPEPDVNEYWSDINEYVRKNNLEKLLLNIINDTSFLYCFQEEYSLMSIPIKRMQETKNDFIRHGINEIIPENKKNFLYSILKINKDISKKLIE